MRKVSALEVDAWAPGGPSDALVDDEPPVQATGCLDCACAITGGTKATLQPPTALGRATLALPVLALEETSEETRLPATDQGPLQGSKRFTGIVWGVETDFQLQYHAKHVTGAGQNENGSFIVIGKILPSGDYDLVVTNHHGQRRLVLRKDFLTVDGDGYRFEGAEAEQEPEEGSQIYTCKQCPKFFFSRKYLQKHYGRAHPEADFDLDFAAEAACCRDFGREVRFFAGLEFLEPGADDNRFQRKVYRVFNDRVAKQIKRLSFLILLGRIGLNGYVNIRPLVSWEASIGPDDTREARHARVRAGICNSLTRRGDREACAEDLNAVASAWRVDVESQYSISAEIVYKFERFAFCGSAVCFVVLLFIGSVVLCVRPPREQLGYRYLLEAKRFANRTAGLSVLKVLLFFSLPVLSLLWNAEWLAWVRSLFFKPKENTGDDAKPLHLKIIRKFRAVRFVATLILILLSISMAFRCFQVKLLEHQHLLYKQMYDWTKEELYQFLNLLNIVMSIFDVELIIYKRTMLFAFGGKDAKIDVAEWEKMESYEILVLQSAKSQFGCLDFLIIALRHNSAELQQIMVADDDRDSIGGAHSELLGNIRHKPGRMLLLCFFAVSLGVCVLGSELMAWLDVKVKTPTWMR